MICAFFLSVKVEKKKTYDPLKKSQRSYNIRLGHRIKDKPNHPCAHTFVIFISINSLFIGGQAVKLHRQPECLALFLLGPSSEESF